VLHLRRQSLGLYLVSDRLAVFDRCDQKVALEYLSTRASDSLPDDVLDAAPTVLKPSYGLAMQMSCLANNLMGLISPHV
jgi:hypothetical protein